MGRSPIPPELPGIFEKSSRRYDREASVDLSRNFNDGPENFAARIRSLQQNVLYEDRWRNGWIFRERMFDLRSNGTVKRIGLVLWAVLLLCLGLNTCVSLVPSGSLAIVLVTCLLVGLPALGASVAAIWTACFFRPRAPHSHLRHHGHY